VLCGFHIRSLLVDTDWAGFTSAKRDSGMPGMPARAIHARGWPALTRAIRNGHRPAQWRALKSVEMNVTGTTTVEFDQKLLAELRQRTPGKSDRELLEELAVTRLGDDAIGRIREAFAEIPQEDIEGEAVKGVRDVRRERTTRPTG